MLLFPSTLPLQIPKYAVETADRVKTGTDPSAVACVCLDSTKTLDVNNNCVSLTTTTTSPRITL